MENGTHIEILLEFGNLWLRDDSVVQVNINEGVHMRTREAEKLMATIGNLSRHTTRPIVVDLRHIGEIDTAAKLYLLGKHAEVNHQCIAMVINSALGQWVANLSLLFRASGCPSRYFTTETAALKWCQRFLAPQADDQFQGAAA